jgi:predicted metal-dependent enzyme (double-stranded beta helix superfamily)
LERAFSESVMTLKNRSENIDKLAIQQTKRLSLVSHKPHLNETVQAVLPLDIKEQPELFRLVYEYCELAYKPELTRLDTERIGEIYELAEYDEVLEDWINKVDSSVDPIFIAMRQQERISLQDFFSEIEAIRSQDMTVEKFKILAEKLHLNDCLVKKHVHFQDRDYCRQLICHTSHCSIFIISWKPNQRTQAHSHANDLGVIRVYEGTLTHSIYDAVKERYVHEGREGQQLKYSKKEEYQAEKNTWVCIDNGKIHQLGNSSSENLVTIHFRYFKQPIQREDEESAIVLPSHSI